MAKNNKFFICTQCGNHSSQWMGKCTSCHQWNSYEEEKISGKRSESSRQRERKPKNLSEIKIKEKSRVTSGFPEFDKILGGGFTRKSLVLFSGEPGVGKSTFLLQIAKSVSDELGHVLYISGEESEEQLAERAKRLTIETNKILLFCETDWLAIKEAIIDSRAALIIVDSLQTVANSGIGGHPGSLSQIREVIFELMNLCHERGMIIIVIGHINKEGVVAGPKTLEHMVDAAFYLEGEKSQKIRILRAIKNRFYSLGKSGVLLLEEKGFTSFIGSQRSARLNGFPNQHIGRVSASYIEGDRPVVVEIQALVIKANHEIVKRNVHGIELKRLEMLEAICSKYLGLSFTSYHIYISIIGSFKSKAQDFDLGVLACLISSYRNVEIGDDHLFSGEIDLCGNIRKIKFDQGVRSELAALGFKKFLIPGQIENIKDLDSMIFPAPTKSF